MSDERTLCDKCGGYNPCDHEHKFFDLAKTLAQSVGYGGYIITDFESIIERAMPDYVQAAIQAERERCAEIARRHNEAHQHESRYLNCGSHIAAAIERLED